ncbi:hypothetical protein L1987_14566 [Smallanthus sonchifolius]|uniref:Uncharacterized protein n=1 Tax=Smallanthus sonchifolius TaxID=185202 RepID=A0ACB9J6M7_9ASTR|nr:hypothetical protein L1987_14566 [Smallanthus sonchifolius]
MFIDIIDPILTLIHHHHRFSVLFKYSSGTKLIENSGLLQFLLTYLYYFTTNSRMEELGLGLVSLLRIAWIAATLPILVSWLPFPGLGWFRRALLGFAGEARFCNPTLN